MASAPLTLFSGAECCLCDDAKQLLRGLPNYGELQIAVVDVKSDHQLYHLYGARIPVLKRTDSGAELGWPFDVHSLAQFLS